jgi:hypothetical protein
VACNGRLGREPTSAATVGPQGTEPRTHVTRR